MNPEIDITIVLKKRRAESSFTQGEIAELADIGRSRYGSYEEGRAEPDISTLIKIANACGYNSLDGFLEIDKTNGQAGWVMAYLRLSHTKRKIVDFILNIKS